MNASCRGKFFIKDEKVFRWLIVNTVEYFPVSWIDSLLRFEEIEETMKKRLTYSITYNFQMYVQWKNIITNKKTTDWEKYLPKYVKRNCYED